MSATQKLLRFGVFELNLATAELRKGGTPIKLAPQPFRLLTLLASRAGQIVTREEIQEQLWDKETYVDFEQGMNHCIKQIRNVLNDNADTPLYIETLPRRGYRFLAPVVSKEIPTPAPRVTESKLVAERHSRSRAGSTSKRREPAGHLRARRRECSPEYCDASCSHHAGLRGHARRGGRHFDSSHSAHVDTGSFANTGGRCSGLSLVAEFEHRWSGFSSVNHQAKTHSGLAGLPECFRASGSGVAFHGDFHVPENGA